MATTFKKSTAREYFESIVIAVILALFIRTWVVQAFKIPTGSMEQNLLVGDHLLVNKFVFSPTAIPLERLLLPQRGRSSGATSWCSSTRTSRSATFIKRVIGLPRETLEIKEKRIYINGELLDEPYLTDQMPKVELGAIAIDGRDNFGPSRGACGALLRDGGQPGQLAGQPVLGSVAAQLPQGAGDGCLLVVRRRARSYFPSRVSVRRPAGLSSVVVHFFTRTRWDRMLRQVH